MAQLKKTKDGWIWTGLRPEDLIPCIDGEITNANIDLDIIKTYLQKDLPITTFEPQVCWCALPSITGNTDCCKNCPNNKNKKTDKVEIKTVDVKTFTSNLGTNSILEETDDYVTPENFRDDVEMSMRALSELETQKTHDTIKKSINRIEKELKAFEIIKKKRIDVHYLQECKNLKQYNNSVEMNWSCRKEAEYHNEILTQEEYDLLKEVLE